LRAGMPGVPVYSLLLVCVLPLQVHTRPRVQRAPGIPHALHGARVSCTTRARGAAGRKRVPGMSAGFDVIAATKSNPDSVNPGRCEASNPESRDYGSGADAPSRNDGTAV
jgi:hypothetical protein